MSVSRGRRVTLAALAAFAGAGLLHGAEEATFHLPVAARWGQIVLQPGDYKMYLPEVSTGEMEFLVKGAGKTVYEVPVITSPESISSSSYFKLQEIDGNYFIREFASGPAGEKFMFSVPKTDHHKKAKSGSRNLTVSSD